MKGNIIVGQSGGPTAAINSSLAGIYCAAKDLGANKVYGMENGIQGLLEERFIDLDDYLKNDLDVDLLKRTPAAFLGSCRYKMPKFEGNEALYDRVFEIIEKLDVELFVYIGGNDSMDTIKQLSDYAAKVGYTKTRFMGCPKTIDNDLAITDHTPGFGSAAKYIGTSVKEVIRDASCIQYSKGFVTIIEIMGRNAGWLTGAAALSRGEDCKGPDMIYLPEVAFDVEDFMARVKKLMDEKGYVIAVVSEGIKLADGRYVCELGSGVDFVDSFGHKQLTGTAACLCNLVAAEIGCKTRAVEFSTLQRAASHMASLTDLNESYAAGYNTVLAGDRGETGKMVIFVRNSEFPYQCGVEVFDIHQIANAEKVVPREWITEDGTDVTEDFVNYVRPLIRGEVAQIMIDGIPRHLYR